MGIWGESKPRRWTISGIECWQRGCICDGCKYKDFFEDSDSGIKCQMIKSVINGVKYLGTPPGLKEKTVIEEE